MDNWLALEMEHENYNDESLPGFLKKKFYTKPIGSYSGIPSNPPTSPDGEDEDCVVNYKRLANYLLRKEFFNLLFGSSIANHVFMECYNNSNKGFENIIYSTNFPDAIEASEEFLDTGKGDRECRLFDYLAVKLIDCTDMCQLLCVLLNCKKIMKPNDPMFPCIILFGLLISNLRHSLIELPNHCYKKTFFLCKNIINLETFENQYITKRDTYKKLFIIRSIPFVFPSPNSRSEMNSQFRFMDKDRVSWKVQPLINYLTGDSKVFILSKENLSNSLTKNMEPRLGGMSYYCKTFKNVQGTATIETNTMFTSDECYSYNNTNFHNFGSALVITDRRKGNNRFRTSVKKSLMEIEPVILVEEELKILTFMEKSLVEDMAPNHMTDNIYIGDISLLPFSPLKLPFGSVKTPDEFIPFDRLLKGYM